MIAAYAHVRFHVFQHLTIFGATRLSVGYFTTIQKRLRAKHLRHINPKHKKALKTIRFQGFFAQNTEGPIQCYITTAETRTEVFPSPLAHHKNP